MWHPQVKSVNFSNNQNEYEAFLHRSAPAQATTTGSETHNNKKEELSYYRRPSNVDHDRARYLEVFEMCIKNKQDKCWRNDL